MLARLAMLVSLAAMTALGWVPAASGGQQDARSVEQFENRVRPLLADKCWGCHASDKQEASLRLDSRAAMLTGGDSGPAIVPGDPEHSPMIIAVRYHDEPKMPPDGRLNGDQIATLTAWIREGAVRPDYPDAKPEVDTRSGTDALLDRPLNPSERDTLWAFRPVADSQPPETDAAEAESTSPIDRFIHARLRQRGLSKAPRADKRTLIRRAYFDLVGLPPPYEEVEAFVADTSEGAFATLVDKLLDSPHYGERWGRHWLDVARYADSGGYETDIYYRNAWRYRDYVVKSFNDDKPYDRFVQEQIAADEIWPDDLALDGSYEMPKEKLAHLEARIGTGLYTLGPQIHESNMDVRKLDYERLTDWADTTGSVFLGLTFGCARCHDHKFDPISQRDYYSLQAVFAGSREVEIPLVNGMEIADFKQHYPRIVAVDEARRAYRLFEQRIAGRELTDEEKTERSELRDRIVEAVLNVPPAATSAPNDPFDGLMEIPTASVLGHVDRPLIKPVHVLGRGDLDRAKRPVEPDLPAILRAGTDYHEPLAGPYTSRKQLALWLTSPDHPLTARVMVNRIWQWHFGDGLVATPNDFGAMGTPPSHPLLLDWLARRFVEHGYSIKQMHRLIMSSETYQRSSVYGNPQNLAVDADNRLLWRAPRRRLEAEVLWDTIHATAGTLNTKMGGRPVVPPLAEEVLSALRDRWKWTVSADPAQHTRRGLYILVRRNFRFPMFDVFDSPVNSVSSPRRNVTVVAPQTLWSLNNQRAWRQAQHFAARLAREAGGNNSQAYIDRAWKIALAREPTSQETSDAVRLLDSLAAAFDVDPGARDSSALVDAPEPLQTLKPARAAALAQFCLTLFNLNEFLFVD